MRSLRAALLLLALAASPGSGQERPSRAVGILLSQSVSSASAADRDACLCAQARDVLTPVSISSIEIELALPLRATGSVGIEYAPRAMPLALVRNNPLEAATMTPGGGWRMSPDTPRSSTLGFGLKPLALRGWAGSDRVRVEAEAAAGVALFGTPALASNATRFNFVYDFAVGVRVGFSGAHVAFGFRRHHLSNAGLGEVNPGLDSHMGYLGVWLD